MFEFFFVSFILCVFHLHIENFKGQLHLLSALCVGDSLVSLFFFVFSNCLSFIHTDNVVEIENASLP